MFLREDDADRRINNPRNLANRLGEFRNRNKIISSDENVVIIDKSRGSISPNLPVHIKDEIAHRALSGEEKVKDIAREYGVAQSTVTNIRREATEEIRREDSVKDAALDKMMLALGLITPEKLEKETPKILASVAASMARCVDATTPKNNQAPNVNLVIYAPRVKNEDNYRVVEL